PTAAPAAAARLRRYVEHPLLTGIQVRFDGFETYDVLPMQLPDLLAERPLLLQGKWRGEPRGRIVVSGTTGEGAFERTLAVAEARPDAAHRALRELWARTRVADLSDWGGTGPDG